MKEEHAVANWALFQFTGEKNPYNRHIPMFLLVERETYAQLNVLYISGLNWLQNIQRSIVYINYCHISAIFSL